MERLTQHYDPNILKQFGGSQDPAIAWMMFSSITSAMLVIRGMNSDVLPLPLAQRMVDSAFELGGSTFQMLVTRPF